MPPRRRLPDECLVSVFKALYPKVQLKASWMSPRFAILVGKANELVSTLVITNRYCSYYTSLFNLEKKINYFFLASKLSVTLLRRTPGESFPGDYPLCIDTYSHLKWCMLELSDTVQVLDAATIAQIVTAFPAVTDLLFVTTRSEHSDSLAALLQHPGWQCQLTSLMVNGTRRMNIFLAARLLAAINGLSALQHLALDWDNDATLPDMTILSRLQVCIFHSNHQADAFMRSLEQNATENERLQVHLLFDDTIQQSLAILSPAVRSRIFRIEKYSPSHHRDLVPLLCDRFRSLTSLSFSTMAISSRAVAQLFADLSQILLLAHLEIELRLNDEPHQYPPPRAQLNSLRALALTLRITSHSQIEWLNLQWTAPHLKTILIKKFRCEGCSQRIEGRGIYDGYYLARSCPSAMDCCRSSLFRIHAGVPLKRVFIEPSVSSAQELLRKESQIKAGAAAN